MPTYANVDQVLTVSEYKGELNNQPIITELTQYEWELVTRKRVKQHISNTMKEIITNSQFRSGNQDLIVRDNPAWDLGKLSHGGGYPRWAHIHLVQFKLFLLFLFLWF